MDHPSLPPSLSKQGQRVAEEQFRTKSELVREALRRHPEERAFSRSKEKITRKFRRLGVRTEEDVERLVDEGRS